MTIEIVRKDSMEARSKAGIVGMGRRGWLENVWREGR